MKEITNLDTPRVAGWYWVRRIGHNQRTIGQDDREIVYVAIDEEGHASVRTNGQFGGDFTWTLATIFNSDYWYGPIDDPWRT